MFTHELCTGDIAIACGKIAGIGKYDGEKELDVSGRIVCPGFLDAHIHIESSLSVPREFARCPAPTWTLSTTSWSRGAARGPSTFPEAPPHVLDAARTRASLSSRARWAPRRYQTPTKQRDYAAIDPTGAARHCLRDHRMLR